MTVNAAAVYSAKLTTAERAVTSIVNGDVHFGPDYHEGTQAFIEKRAPNF